MIYIYFFSKIEMKCLDDIFNDSLSYGAASRRVLKLSITDKTNIGIY